MNSRRHSRSWTPRHEKFNWLIVGKIKPPRGLAPGRDSPSGQALGEYATAKALWLSSGVRLPRKPHKPVGAIKKPATFEDDRLPHEGRRLDAYQPLLRLHGALQPPYELLRDHQQSKPGGRKCSRCFLMMKRLLISAMNSARG